MKSQNDKYLSRIKHVLPRLTPGRCHGDRAGLLVAGVLSLIIMAGCGAKGELYLPEEPQNASTAASGETAKQDKKTKKTQDP